eukprot:352930-Karenia_brevis.AAC.1
MQPKPQDILNVPVETQENEETKEEYSTEGWLNYIWELQIVAVHNPNVQCWTCVEMGHLGKDCPNKGKGKGGGKPGKGGGKAGGKAGGKQGGKFGGQGGGKAG